MTYPVAIKTVVKVVLKQIFFLKDPRLLAETAAF